MRCPTRDEACHPDGADVFVVERGHPALHRIDGRFDVADAGHQDLALRVSW